MVPAWWLAYGGEVRFGIVIRGDERRENARAIDYSDNDHADNGNLLTHKALHCPPEMALAFFLRFRGFCYFG